MGYKVTLETVLKRYEVQVREVHKLREESVVNGEYTAYITCQGTHPGRTSGKGHKKCGRRTPLMYAYKCLYCSFWFCPACAEKHFGKTREQYKKEKEIASEKQ
jgi:hypothetical protein